MNGEFRIRKYPRTPHLEGSRLQIGDEDLAQVPFEALRGRNLVIEEKIDGANSAVSFSPDGRLLLQSRGHYLTGGYREKHYQLFKTWAGVHQNKLYEVLGSRYIMYGEWMYAKHSIYYDALPHYFMEFDVYDRERDIYLDTVSRRRLTSGLPICSVSVLGNGIFRKKDEILCFLGNSGYISENHIQHLRETAEQEQLDPDRICRETDPSRLMEGLYIKVEENGEVQERVKYVRAGFLQVVETSSTHWLERPIVPNGLKRNMEALFLAELRDKE